VIDLGFFDRVGADWSPDGSQVAFAAFSHRHLGLFVVNADGTRLRQITPPGLGAVSAPAGSLERPAAERTTTSRPG
jgi:Tol biopolymer transport system component